MQAPLDGIRVIDLTRILAGPFATMQLADLGADVIKVERPGQGDETRRWGPPFREGVATYFEAVNRGKRSVTLDLKTAAGCQVLWALLADADVLVSNFRPGVMERLGFGPDRVAERCPRIVDGVINGYGDHGPLAGRAAFDLVIQAESGLMSITGEAEGQPIKSGVSIADEVAGLYLVQGVLAALIARGRTGRGQRVEVALFDAMLSIFTYQAQQYLSCGVEPRRMGNDHPSLVPYRPFDTADRQIVVGVASDELWQRFCRAIDRLDLAGDTGYATNADRVRCRERLEATLSEHLRHEVADTWLQRLESAGVPCGSIHTLPEALEGEAAREREIVDRTEDAGTPFVRGPLRCFGRPRAALRPPPRLGQHTTEVLAALGYDEARLASLRSRGVI